jgi:acyl-ACP thioesterase
MFLGISLRSLLLYIIMLGPNVIADYLGAQSATDHAPIRVILNHYHKEGEWVISARQSHLRMSGHIFNGDAISGC